MKFEELNIKAEILKAIDSLGFEEPSPIQEQAIPVIMAGKDIIGQAQTGTGKTLAFGIPILDKLDLSEKRVGAIVMVPTRELAIQVADEIKRAAKFMPRMVITAVYGGVSIERQIQILKKRVDIVVGTPGRILDHIGRGTLDLSNVQFVVLDEADEMLDMGFHDDIIDIVRKTPKDRQTMLFSATMPDAIKRIARDHQRDPEFITVSKGNITVEGINQIYYEVAPHEKFEALVKIIDTSDAEGMFLVFGQTKRVVDEISFNLQGLGYNAEGIHGDYSQARREQVLGKFRKGQLDILVATDVAARGLDIQGVSHVINYSTPQNPDSYIHRIGRTGRQGKLGVAVTLVTRKERHDLYLIQETTRVPIKRENLPERKLVNESKRELFKDVVKTINEKEDVTKYSEIIDQMALNDISTDRLVAIMAKIIFDGGLSKKSKETTKTTATQERGSRSGMAVIHIEGGRSGGLTPAAILRTISSQRSLDSRKVGKINIFGTHAEIEVPEEVAGEVEDLFKNMKPEDIGRGGSQQRSSSFGNRDRNSKYPDKRPRPASQSREPRREAGGSQPRSESGSERRPSHDHHESGNAEGQPREKPFRLGLSLFKDILKDDSEKKDE